MTIRNKPQTSKLCTKSGDHTVGNYLPTIHILDDMELGWSAVKPIH